MRLARSPHFFITAPIKSLGGYRLLPAQGPLAQRDSVFLAEDRAGKPMILKIAVPAPQHYTVPTHLQGIERQQVERILRNAGSSGGPDGDLRYLKYKNEFEILRKLDLAHSMLPVEEGHDVIRSVGGYPAGTFEVRYFVYEFAPGLELAGFAERHAPRPANRDPRIRLSVSAGFCRALRWLHEQGVAHLDLNLRNAIVSDLDRRPATVRLLDFESAQLLDGGEVIPGLALRQLTHVYAAPEQRLFFLNKGATSDVYSLCAIVLEILTGRNVYRELSDLGNIPDGFNCSDARISNRLAHLLTLGLRTSPCHRDLHLEDLEEALLLE